MIVCFGEVMGRLMPPAPLRLAQALPGRLDLTFAGAEANVAAAVAQLGGRARCVTVLPDNEVGRACLAYYRGLGIDVSRVVLRAGARMGLFFAEGGAAQRGGKVVYDRDGSAFAGRPPGEYDWDDILDGARWLFVTGISPAVSEAACEATLAAIRAAREKGVRVAFDPNHRRTLWRWAAGRAPEVLARDIFERILPDTDLLLTNGDQVADLLGGEPFEPTADGALRAAREIARRHPGLRRVALTLRTLHAAHDHSWGAALYDAESGLLHAAPESEGRHTPYRITQVVDRLGTGDAFAGGLLYALETPELSASGTALAFATAHAALSHTVVGDVAYANREEVEALLAGAGDGRIAR